MKKQKTVTMMVRYSTRNRVHRHKGLKKNRKKNESVLETVDDVINKIFDFYEANYKEDSP